MAIDEEIIRRGADAFADHCAAEIQSGSATIQDAVEAAASHSGTYAACVAGALSKRLERPLEDFLGAAGERADAAIQKLTCRRSSQSEERPPLNGHRHSAAALRSAHAFIRSAHSIERITAGITGLDPDVAAAVGDGLAHIGLIDDWRESRQQAAKDELRRLQLQDRIDAARKRARGRIESTRNSKANTSDISKMNQQKSSSTESSSTSYLNYDLVKGSLRRAGRLNLGVDPVSHTSVSTVEIDGRRLIREEDYHRARRELMEQR
jgi:hypothetical protein